MMIFLTYLFWLIVFVYVFIILLSIFITSNRLEIIKKTLSAIIAVVVVLYILKSYIADAPGRKASTEKQEELQDLSLADVKYLSIYNIPNYDIKFIDSITIYNKDSIRTIFNLIKTAKELPWFSYSHPHPICEMILSVHLKNGNKIDFSALNTSNYGTILELLSYNFNVESGFPSGIPYRSDSLGRYVDYLCDKINSKVESNMSSSQPKAK